jgi:hypothetical protein
LDTVFISYASRMRLRGKPRYQALLRTIGLPEQASGAR